MTKQLSIKSLTDLPGWENYFTTSNDRISSAGQAYGLVPLVFRALRLRCDALVSPDIVIENLKGKEARWPYKISPKRLLWLSQAGMLTKGGSYWLKRENATGRTAEIAYLNPFNVQVIYTGQGLAFQYSGSRVMPDGRIEQITTTYNQEQVAYIKEFNPTDDVNPGPSAISVGMQDAAMLRYVTRFAAKFFEGGAMPVTLVTMESGSNEEVKRVESWFKNFTAGISNAWNSLGVRAKIGVTTITPPLNSLQMPELTMSARSNIALAFGIPQTMLEDAANFATAKEHRLSFYQDTVEPSGELICDELNEQLLKPNGLTMKIDWQSLDLYQEDETARAGSLQALVASGIPLDMATEILGYDFDEAQMARLKEVKPVETDIPALSPVDEAPEMADAELMKSELLKFQRKAMKRIGESVPFVSDILPADWITIIQRELPDCKDAEDVRVLFGMFADDKAIPQPDSEANALAEQIKRAMDYLEAHV